MTDSLENGPSPAPVPRRGRAHARFASLALLGATVAVLVGALEVGVRVLAPQPLFVYRFSPDSWYAPAPGGEFVYARGEFRHRIVYNDLGMRDGPIPASHRDGVLRIALLGDSYAEGLEVAMDETVGRRLQRRLEQGPLAPVEVVNLGVSGYSPVQSLKRFVRLAPVLVPDHVVFLASQNDFADNLSPRSRQLYTRGHDGLELRDIEASGLRLAAFRIKDFLKSHVMAYQFVRDRLHSLGGAGGDSGGDAVPAGNAGEPGQPPSAEEQDMMRLVLGELGRACDARGIALTASMVTRKHADDPASLVPCFRDICREEGIDFVDLTPAFREREARGDRLFFVIDGHWNADGHDCAAEALAAHLERTLSGDQP